MYQSLDPDSIIKTVKILRRRIAERFDGRGIVDVSNELVMLTEKAKSQAVTANLPDWPLRLVVGAMVVGSAALFLSIGTFISFSRVTTDAPRLVLGIESSINTLIFAGIAVVFLFIVERRQKRQRVLEALHELRSMVHIIDMHQLTKDPSALLGGGSATKSSPKRTMNEFQLTRYLGYCMEMLSICGKVSVLYAQNMKDPVIITAVNEIEILSANLSGKIWQKIALMHQNRDSGPSHSEIKTALMGVAGRKD